MRRVFRRRLSVRSTNTLQKEQANANAKQQTGTLNINAEWNRARRNRPLREAFNVLQTMAGERERCMYCGDSHGTDIEHFWPKAPYPDRMFQWPNMLLCCTECGRIKGVKFPIEHDMPLMIDPSVDNPWNFLDFNPQTGNIVARYDPANEMFFVKGSETVRVLELDRREAMARSYQRTFRRIKRVIEEVLEQPNPNADALFRELSEADDHGLLGWCFDGLGSRVVPFTDFQHRHPTVWAACEQAYRTNRRP
ncbi:MAG: hypothetical protein EOM24_03475 [Chloroflexia bacterium]|nr:hypothetical protein [Chloroflexia bacterium]